MRKQQRFFALEVLAAAGILGIFSGAASGDPTLYCGSDRSGEISYVGEVDTFRIELKAGQNVIIDVDANSIGSGLDATVGFFDTDGTTLITFSNDYFPPDEGSTLDPFLAAAADVDGTYYIKMTSDADNDFDGTGAGSDGEYRIKIRCVDADPKRRSNDTPETATEIGCETNLTEMFLGFQDVDWYAVALIAGATVTVDLDRLDNNLDGQAALYAPDGTTQLAFSDDDAAPGEPSGLEPYFNYTVPADGVYYVAVGSHDDDDFDGDDEAGSFGFYNLIVDASPCRDKRVSSTQKGSFLIWSKVELRWGAGPGFPLTQDTIIELTNDNNEPVCVQLYIVHGDEPLEEISAGDPPMVIAEEEPGWEWVDCSFCLTHDQPTYWSMATGLGSSAGGCQAFTTLDPDNGSGPGRPDPDRPGSRIMRGFVYGWAVDNEGAQIRWDHLTGGATLINYLNSDAWEYNAWAFQANRNCHEVCEEPGKGNYCIEGHTECDEVAQGEPIGRPGRIRFDGSQYDYAYDLLLMEFFEPGSQALSGDSSIVSVDMDLTLHPVTADLRQDSIGPVTTKAKFDIWDENERGYSGTTRCITCWDQTLLSQYEIPNNFTALQTDKGKARIDGMQSEVCDLNCARNEMNTTSRIDIDFFLDILGIDHVCSYDAALLGVVAKVLAFSGAAANEATAGRNLVGMGTEEAWVRYDIIEPPGTLHTGEAEGLRGVREIGKASGRDTAEQVDVPVAPSN